MIPLFFTAQQRYYGNLTQEKEIAILFSNHQNQTSILLKRKMRQKFKIRVYVLLFFYRTF